MCIRDRPNTDNSYDLGSSSQEWKDLYVDGIAYLDGINFNGTAISATAAELNIMDGVTSTAAELNILDGVTSTAAELNILDGVTSTAAELNILDGVTSTTAELNILDGVTSTTAELNILDGATVVVGEINALDLGSTAVGTAIASKAVILDSNKDYTGVRNFTITGELDAATLDISGDADIDGTLEADAITIGGVTLAETIADTVGAMVSSNTESGITVAYEDADNTLDFTVGTLNQDTTGTADNFTVSANNSSDETVYPVFVDGATGSQGAETDTGLTYNPSTGLLTATGFSGNLTGTLQTAAQTNITSLGTLTALTGGTGDFNWDSNTLVVDSSANRVGILNAAPDVSLDIGSATDAVHVPVGTTAQRPGSPAAGYFRYNSTTSKFEGYTDEWGSIGGGSGTNMDTNIYTGDGSTTAFTLSNAPDDENNLMIFVDGVFQAHNAYSVSGTTLTLSAAPASGRVITAYHSTTTVGGSNNTINTMTGDNSDTTLTLSVAPVHENNVQVYFDGVYQSKSNYSISGTTLTFSTAPPTGVLVEAITNTNTSSTTANILLDADSDTKIQVEESSDEDKIRFDVAGTEEMVMDATGIVINDGSNDRDFRIESDTNANSLFLEGSTSHIGLGTGSPDDNSFGAGHGILAVASATGSAKTAMLNLMGDGNDTDATRVSSIFFNDQSATGAGKSLAGVEAYRASNHATDPGGDLLFSTNVSGGSYAEHMRIASTGNVGIGDTVPAWGSNYRAVTVGSTGSIWASKTGTSGSFISDNSYFNGSNNIARNANAGSEYAQSTGHHVFYTAASVSAGATQTMTTVLKTDPNGAVTMPLQPAFNVKNSSNQNNIALATDVTVLFQTEIFDIGSNFASNTFTAPVTGKYQLNAHIRWDSLNTAHDYVVCYIITSNNAYYSIIDPDGFDSNPAYFTQNVSVLADMDANDTAHVQVVCAGGSATSDIASDNGSTSFSGVLVA